MSGRRRLEKATSLFQDKKKDVDQIYSGLLGLILDGSERVEVSGRQNFVYVRLRDNQSEVIQAFNRQVSPIYDYPVLVKRSITNPSIYEVIDVDKDKYFGKMGASSVIPKHAPQHMFNPDEIGADIVWAFDRQLMPLLVHPSGTAGSCNVVIESDVYYQDGQWKFAGVTGSPELCSLKPTGSSTAKMVLLYLDSASNPQVVEGNEFDGTITGTAQVLPFVPSLPTTSSVPLAWIRLVSGTERILWDNIYDARPWIVGDGVVSTGTARHVIQDEGSNLADRPYLDFVGNLVEVTDVGGKTQVSITGSTAGHRIQDDGSFETDRASLNFIGDSVFVNDDFSNDRTNIIISGTVGHVIQDEGNVKTDRDYLNFIGPLLFVEDDGGNNRTNVIVSGSSGGHVIQDEGVAEIDRNALNFTGDGVFVEDDVGNNRTDVIISGSSGGGHVIQDEGVEETQRPNLNFTGDGVFVEDDGGNDRTNVIVSGSGASLDYATLEETQTGTSTTKVVTPSVVPVLVWDGGLVRKDQNLSGDARGDGSVDFQKDRNGDSTAVAAGESTFIGGGKGNRIDAGTFFGAIVAGDENVLGGDSTRAFIGVGGRNSISESRYATIVNGEGSWISGSYGAAMLVADSSKIADSLRSLVLYGFSNVIVSGSQYASAEGRYAENHWYGSDVKAVGRIGGSTNQKIDLFWGNQTTNATQKELFLDLTSGKHRAVLDDDTTWVFEIWVSARRTDAQNESAGYHFRGVIDRQTGASSVALVGSVTKTTIGEDTAAWDADVDADIGAGSLRILVTGEAGKTISWFARGIITQSQ